jgi:hypothetical protein
MTPAQTKLRASRASDTETKAAQKRLSLTGLEGRRGRCPSTIGLLRKSSPPGYARRSPTGAGPHERLTPGTLKSYFCPEAKAIVKWCAWGIVGARRGEPFGLLIRRQTRLSRGVKGILVTGIAVAMLAIGISGFRPKHF